MKLGKYFIKVFWNHPYRPLEDFSGRMYAYGFAFGLVDGSSIMIGWNIYRE